MVDIMGSVWRSAAGAAKGQLGQRAALPALLLAGVRNEFGWFWAQISHKVERGHCQKIPARRHLDLAHTRQEPLLGQCERYMTKERQSCTAVKT